MSELWHVRRGEQTQTVSSAELAVMAADGRVSPETLLSQDGQAWFAARELNALWSQERPRSHAASAVETPTKPSPAETSAGRGTGRVMTAILTGACAVLFLLLLIQCGETDRYRDLLLESRREETALRAQLAEMTQERDELRRAGARAQRSAAVDSRGSTATPRSQPLQVKIEPQITLPRAPERRSVDVVVRSVSVYDTKSSGSPWDESGPPDPQVWIRKSYGSDERTSVAKDTTYGVFNQKLLRVSEGDTIEITVVDADVLADDTIGTYSKLITADTLAERRVSWSFGRVSALELEFQP